MAIIVITVNTTLNLICVKSRRYTFQNILKSRIISRIYSDIFKGISKIKSIMFIVGTNEIYMIFILYMIIITKLASSLIISSSMIVT